MNCLILTKSRLAIFLMLIASFYFSMPSVAHSQSTTDTLLMLNATKQIQNNRQNEEIKKELKLIRKGMGIEEPKPKPKELNKSFSIVVIAIFGIFGFLFLLFGSFALAADFFGEQKHLDRDFEKAQAAYFTNLMLTLFSLSIAISFFGMLIIGTLPFYFGLSDSVTGTIGAISFLSFPFIILFGGLIYGSSSAYHKRLQRLQANGIIRTLPKTFSATYLRKEKNFITFFFILPYWISLVFLAGGLYRCISVIGYHVAMTPLHNFKDLLIEGSKPFLPILFTFPIRFFAKRRLAFIASLPTEIDTTSDTQQKKLDTEQNSFFIKLSDNRIKGPFSKAKIKEGIKQNKIPSGCFVSQLKTGPWKALPTG